MPIMVSMCVSVHYNAYLEYGDEPFDSTYLRRRPQSFNLGMCFHFASTETVFKLGYFK